LDADSLESITLYYRCSQLFLLVIIGHIRRNKLSEDIVACTPKNQVRLFKETKLISESIITQEPVEDED
jgi:heterodisulfide reductase subunit A-like polyferredoxin